DKVSIDLSQYGIEATIDVPDTTKLPLVLEAMDYGELTVHIGDKYHFSFIEGGDMNLKKSDLESDLLFVSTILEEKPNLIIYKSDLPDGSITYHHFYSIVNINGVDFEVSDINTGDSLSEENIRKMVEILNTIKVIKTIPS
ncbi:MAG: hypothetical protein MRY83_15210, partial [Flavobacteriales bacterium]|nr:hypothetical protein [Flavobacteriales bacterium]